MLVEPFFRSALEHINEGVFFVDSALCVVYINPAAAAMCGIDAPTAIGIPVSKFLTLYDAEATDAAASAPLSELLRHAAEGPVCGRFFLQHLDGHRLHIEMRLLAVHDDDGNPLGIQGIMTDASAQIDLSQINRCLHKLIRIDSVTHLPNHRSFIDAMKSEYLRYVRYGIPFALIATTLDNLDQLADQATQPAARNRILQWYSRQMTGALRKSDTPARIRGALFFVLLPHTDAAAAARAARKIQERLSRFPCAQAPSLTASFGCTAIGRKDSLERLQDRARKALHHASNTGGNEVHVL